MNRRRYVVSILVVLLVAVVALVAAGHGWRLGLRGCDVVEGGYVCDGNGSGGELVVFAPGFVDGLDLLSEDVGWMSLGAELFGLRLGVVDAQPEQLVDRTARFIDENDADALIGFSLGGTAALGLAEAGAVERVAVGCAPTDIEAVTARFSVLAGKLVEAGAVVPDPALRGEFDVWRSVYDEVTVPSVDALDAGLVDGWLSDLFMGWDSDHDRYLAIRSAIWLDANMTGRTLPEVEPLTGAIVADLLLIHNELDPVVPVSQMMGYQVMVGENDAGDRITVRVIEGFGHCKLGPSDWLYLMRWLKS